MARTCSAAGSPRERAVVAGLAMQVVTFVVMLVGLKYLYHSSAAGVGHLHFFDTEWYFTLPWMAINGAFGGYTAHAIGKKA
jgi:hypothetical protein